MLPIDKLAQRVDPRFGAQAITDGPKTFLYLFRRFGPSSSGSDSDKVVCQYYIPLRLMPEAWLVIRISGLHAYWQFVASKKISTMLEAQLVAGGGSVVDKCIEAIAAELNDLLRPVIVRDQSITVFGYATEEDFQREVAECSVASGWGVPRPFLMDPELFIEFIRWVTSQSGNGDTTAAMRDLMSDSGGDGDEDQDQDQDQ